MSTVLFITICVIVVLLGLIMVIDEALVASDYTCTIYGGRTLAEAVNPIEWVYRLYIHHTWWYFSLTILTGVIVWGYFLFIPLYAIMRAYREDHDRLTRDKDYISIQFYDKD